MSEEHDPLVPVEVAADVSGYHVSRIHQLIRRDDIAYEIVDGTRHLRMSTVQELKERKLRKHGLNIPDGGLENDDLTNMLQTILEARYMAATGVMRPTTYRAIVEDCISLLQREIDDEP